MALNTRSILIPLWLMMKNVRLGVALLILLSVDLCFGYFFVTNNTPIFEPMNQVGVVDWFTTYARFNIHYTAWFFLFLLLLATLSVNTLACTLSRLRQLFFIRLKWKNSRFLFSLATHVMHLSMVVVLLGYLVSYTLTTIHPSQTLVLQRPKIIGGTGLQVELLAMDLPIYTGNRLEAFSGRVIRPDTVIKITGRKGGKTARLAFNSPVRFKKYTIFLKRFSPAGKGGISSTHYVIIDIRHDPGVPLYFTGIVIFLAGLLSYAGLRLHQVITKK